MFLIYWTIDIDSGDDWNCCCCCVKGVISDDCNYCCGNEFFDDCNWCCCCGVDVKDCDPDDEEDDIDDNEFGEGDDDLINLLILLIQWNSNLFRKNDRFYSNIWMLIFF